jgi:hypothetical protein
LFGFLIIGLSTTGVKWLMGLLKINQPPNPPKIITGDKA